jgi:hypothetical protein
VRVEAAPRFEKGVWGWQLARSWVRLDISIAEEGRGRDVVVHPTAIIAFAVSKVRGMRVAVRVVVRGGGPIIVDANGSSVTVIGRGVTEGCTVIIAIGTVGLRVIV